MNEDEKRTVSRIIEKIMNDVRSTEQKHIDFGENLFHVRDYTTAATAPTHLDLFPERDDSWSIIWYIASFSGLIAFFLIVSCSEWCCRLHVRGPAHSASAASALRPSASSLGTQATNCQLQEAPPPAYDLFAPPSYDSVHKPDVANSSGVLDGLDVRPSEKTEYDVYVVPVHAMRMLQAAPAGHSQPQREDDPPSYISVQMDAQAHAHTHAQSS